MNNPFTPAAWAERLWPKQPTTRPLQCLDEIGLQVKIWDWPGHDSEALAKRSARIRLPGSDEINYPNVTEALQDSSFTGTLAMEACASNKPKAALETFRSAFSV